MNASTTELTQDEKRIKIAEACGWRYFDDPCTRISWFYGPTNRMRPKAELMKDAPAPGRQLFIADEFSFPNYFEDLNACAEMEKSAPMGYGDEVRVIVARYAGVAPQHICDQYVICATAAQRAEAFGRIMHLWP